ncbi:MAG: alpha/beta hydrolase [Janthinobacterium lividum]
MKKLKQIVAQVKANSNDAFQDRDGLLWQLICYAPKMPLRLLQEQFLSTATPFSLSVKDDFFTGKDLKFNGFKWGNGKHKVLITHGWGSKAADFLEIITAITSIEDVEIIAFDAPGNGSSEGELSNLILYVSAIRAIVQHCGKPDIVIGHSLGALANIVAMKEITLFPSLLISIAPLIRLKENFEMSMKVAEVSQNVQNSFFKDFEEKFQLQTSSFNFNNYYSFNQELNHWIAYDQNDKIVPYSYLKEFLNLQPSVKSKNYDEVGHDKILKSLEVIHDLIAEITKICTH